MDRCPLCESYALVNTEKPCYFCGLSLIDIGNHNIATVVPGHILFEPASPEFAETVMTRLAAVNRHVIIDLTEFPVLSSAGVCVIIAVKTVAKQNGLQMAFANVSPDVMKVFQVCRLGKAFRIVDAVEDALESFRRTDM